MVAHDDDFDCKVVARNRRKLVHAHLEAAVAADDNNVAVGPCELRAYSGGDRIAHGAHAARREEASLADTEVVGAPYLVLSDVGDEDRL